MNILLVATFSGVSGATLSLISLAKGLKSLGHNVIVFIPYKGEIVNILEENNINYIVCRSFVWVKPLGRRYRMKDKIIYTLKKIKNIHTEICIYRYIKKYKIDIVHINALTAPWGAKAAIYSKTKLIWHIREMIPIGIEKEFIEEKKSLKLINKADTIIAISKAVQNHYKTKIGKTTLIYNAIDTRINVQRELIFSNSTVSLTFMGRIVPGKGILDLIRACELLKKMNINFHLELYGSGEQDFLNETLKLINDLKLKDNITFKGFTKEVNDIWKNSDIALICTKAEAFGRVTVEAMINQVLVIGANTGATVEIVGENRGLLYEEGNHRDLAKNIIHAIENIDESRLLAKNGQEFVYKNFDLEHLIIKIENEYRK